MPKSQRLEESVQRKVGKALKIERISEKHISNSDNIENKRRFIDVFKLKH